MLYCRKVRFLAVLLPHLVVFLQKFYSQDRVDTLSFLVLNKTESN